MNLPSEEHRATCPAASSAWRLVTTLHTNEGVSRYAEGADFRFPPTVVGTGCVFTQHQGSRAVSLNPLAGDLQSVGPADPEAEQENCSALMRNRYMLRGAVPTGGAKVAAGIEQWYGSVPSGWAGYDDGIEDAAVASGWTVTVASGLFGSTSFGSAAPPSQPTRRSARAGMPKKKFFIFCSPFLRCNFPHPERDVKLSFSHLVTQ